MILCFQRLEEKLPDIGKSVGSYSNVWKITSAELSFFNTGLVKVHFLRAPEKSDKKMNEMLAGTAG